MARIRTIKPDFFRHYDLYQAEKETGLPVRLAFAVGSVFAVGPAALRAVSSVCPLAPAWSDAAPVRTGKEQGGRKC